MNNIPGYLQLFEQFDSPYQSDVDINWHGEDFTTELRLTSHLWRSIGYAPGIAAYLNFFLLKDFIEKHDKEYSPRFIGFKPMADSFYQTDLFVRDVTDSGKKPTGGISSPQVRRRLQGIMARHEKLTIPHWMMSYFGFQLLEATEYEVPSLTNQDRQLHLNYFSKTYRIMGIPFSNDREHMEHFAREIESAHAGPSEHLEKHARNILSLGEMVGVNSSMENIGPKLPQATREVFAPLHSKVSPNSAKRTFLRFAGKVLVKRAIGPSDREARPFDGNNT